ncbi:MAG: DUF7305 domain-containing protein [Planctomycetota bacterium]|jgi:hypothetical protein
MKKLLKSKRSGSAIVLVMLAAVLLMAMGVGLLGLGLRGRILATRNAEQVQARCAADAGLTKALFEMNRQLQIKPWSGSTLPAAKDHALPNSDATCSYSVSGSIAGGYVVQSTGNCKNALKTVNATLRLKGVFEGAIVTRGSLVLKSGTLISGYNSKDPNVTGAEAKIATTSTLPGQVVLNAGVVVNGPVFAGVDGDPDVVISDHGASTDYRTSLLENQSFPTVTVPTLTDMGTSIFVKGETKTIGPADSGQYTGISLKRTATNPAILEISGGDVVLHITGNVSVGEECKIIVKSDASLTLYVDGDIHCRANSSITNESFPDPHRLKIYGTGTGIQNWDIKAESHWCGVVYAPNADIDLYAMGDVYGSFVANSFEFKAGGNFYYDESLKQVSPDEEMVRFIVKRWTEQ